MKPFIRKISTAWRDRVIEFNNSSLFINIYIYILFFFTCFVPFDWNPHRMFVGNGRMRNALRCLLITVILIFCFMFFSFCVCVCLRVCLFPNRASATHWWSTLNGISIFVSFFFFCGFSIIDGCNFFLFYVFSFFFSAAAAALSVICAGTIDPVKFPKRCISCWCKTATQNKVVIQC